MKQMTENKLDMLAKRVQRGEKLETDELLMLMDSMICKGTRPDGGEAN